MSLKTTNKRNTSPIVIEDNDNKYRHSKENHKSRIHSIRLPDKYLDKNNKGSGPNSLGENVSSSINNSLNVSQHKSSTLFMKCGEKIDKRSSIENDNPLLCSNNSNKFRNSLNTSNNIISNNATEKVFVGLNCEDMINKKGKFFIN